MAEGWFKKKRKEKKTLKQVYQKILKSPGKGGGF